MLDFNVLEPPRLDLDVLEASSLGLGVLEPPRLDLCVPGAPSDCYGQCRVVPKCGSADKIRAQITGEWVAKRPTSTAST